MALNKQIQALTVEFPGERFYEIPTQNFNFEFEPIFYGEPTTEALSGRLFQNYRGYRFILDMTWEASIESVTRRIDATTTTQTFRDLLNYMVTFFVVDQNDYVKIYPGDITFALANTSSFIEAVPNVVRYTQRYRSTVGIFIPRLRMRGRDILSEIPSYFEGV